MAKKIQRVIIMVEHFNFKKRFIFWNYVVITEGVKYGVALAVVFLWSRDNVSYPVNYRYLILYLTQSHKLTLLI